MLLIGDNNYEMISYEKLKVYQLSLDCVQLAVGMLNNLPKGYSELSVQLKRAIFSVSLNIAEGAGKTGVLDKRRFYEIAKASAMESAAISDILYRIQLVDERTHCEFKEALHSVISMLSKLCFNLEQRANESGKGQGPGQARRPGVTH